MFSYCSFLSLFICLYCIYADQLCIDRCDFQYDLYSNFTLPQDCNVTRRDRCYVLMIFEYTKELIKVHFSLEPNENIFIDDNQTDFVVRSIINLADPAFIQHSVEYFCTTGDQCDLEFVHETILPIFVLKSCEIFRSKLINYLNPYPPSINRECYQNENSTIKCDSSCELIYTNPNEIIRSCSGDLGMKFETIVGQSTPIDRPEYQYRNYSYACNTPRCNGRFMQEHIENLIIYDHGECLIHFKDMNETTTIVPSKSASIYSSYWILFILLMYFHF